MSVVFFVLVWEAVSRSDMVQLTLFPPPTHVVLSLVEMAASGELTRDFAVSTTRAIVGLGIGSFFGVWIGLLTGRCELMNYVITPLFQILRPLPPVAIIPLVIVWAGIGEASKIFSISFAVFFPVWINTHQGSSQIPMQYLWSAKSLDLGVVATVKKIIVPASLPFIVAGVRNGVAIAFVMVFVSELAGASSGIGYQISVSHLAYRIDRMVASLFILGIAGATTDLAFILAMKWKFRWLELED